MSELAQDIEAILYALTALIGAVSGWYGQMYKKHREQKQKSKNQ